MYRHPMPQAARERQEREHTAHAPAAAEALPSTPFTLSEVLALAARPPRPTASLLLPTHRAGPERQQDHIRLKNLLHGLRRQRPDDAGAAALAGRIAALSERPGFWAHPQEGLAIFATADDIHHLWLPGAVAEQVVLADRCHLKPLMPLLQGDGRFYLLELAQHGVRLLRGSRFTLDEIELPGVPAMVDAGHHGAPEHHLDVRTVRGPGQGAPKYFASLPDQDTKERIRQYFRRVDAAVCALLQGEHAPLVTAGVEFLLPLYWEVNRYAGLIQGGIASDPAGLPPATLHARAWEAVAPHFHVADDRLVEHYGRLRGTAQATDDLATVLRAAHAGRVEGLLVAGDGERWGIFDPASGQVLEHESRGATDGDLLNTALLLALATRARVQVLPRAAIPGQAGLAAVLRY